MRSTRRGAALLVTVLLTALPASYAATRAAGSDRPAVGDCHALTFKQIAHESDSSVPVACSSAHTTRVIKVADLPSGTTWETLTSAQISRLGVTECTPAYRRALGQNDKVRDSSAYAWIFFAPTQTQRAGGAHWIRCDLILLKGRALKSLPTDTVPALSSSRLPDKVRRCTTGTSHLTTVCTATHDFKATGAFTVKGSYPGATKLAGIARHRCPALVSTPRRFLFAHQPKFTWNTEHDHVVVCFSHRSD
jgi:hypothetical protein